jgi:hypothetical protein
MYRHIRAGLGVLIVGLWLLLPLPARGQMEDSAAIEKITNLNKKALEAYNDLEFEDARKLLKQALDLCSSAGLDKHPIKARTHIHMGVVLIAAKQQELGVKQFRKALDIQPDIQVTKALANPEIIQAFEEAGAGSPIQPSGSGPGVAPGESEPGGGTTSPGAGSARPTERTAAPPGASIEHVPVSHGRKGKAIPIAVTVSPDLTGYTKMVLAYRPEGGDDFLPADMRRSGNRFLGEIPAEATNGNHVYYYIEAEAEDETAVASNGSEQKPYFVTLALTTTGGRSASAGTGEDEEEDETPRFFVAILGGSGMGLATGNGEVNADNKVNPGFAPSAAAQIVPEVGYYVSPRFRLSVQLRYQIVTGTTPLNLALLGKSGCGSDNLCTPASRAVAVLARGSWLFGSGTFRPYFSWALGGGQIRHVVKFGSLTPICGPRGGEVCVDTVLSGPIFAGPGGGVLIALTQSFGLVVELESLLGFPKWTYHFDLNAGVAARF